MSERKRWIERGKNLAIVLLLLGAVVLLRQSVYYNFLRERLGNSDAQKTESAASANDTAALRVTPGAIVVSTAEGTRWGAAWDEEKVGEIFGNFSAALGEALGSAAAPVATDENAWRAALTGNAVTIELPGSYPLPLTAAMLGTTAAFEDDYSARLLCLVNWGERVELYFLNETDGCYYHSRTAVSASAFRSKLENYRRSNAGFAFEYEKLRDIAPNTVVLEQLPAFRKLSSDTAVDKGFDLDALFHTLGMNAAAVKQYTESDGTRVYLENGRTVRMDAKGLISCKSGAAGEISAETDARVSAVRSASAFVRSTLQPSAGAAQLCLVAVETYGDGGYRVDFDYRVGGVAVELGGERHAASLTVKRGVVTQAELCPRRYDLLNEELSVLQMLQAAAAAVAGGGKQLDLVYLDKASEIVCVWVSK